MSELRKQKIQGRPGPGWSTGLPGLRPGGRKPTISTPRKLQEQEQAKPLDLVPAVGGCSAGFGVGYGLSSCTTSDVFADRGAAARRSMASDITF